MHYDMDFEKQAARLLTLPDLGGVGRGARKRSRTKDPATFSDYQVTDRPVTERDSLGSAMSNTDLKPRLQQKTKVQKPQLYKVVLLNDDYTPREFVVLILKGEFRLDNAQAEVVMITAHQKGACVVSVYPKDVAETKATRAIDAAGRLGYPLQFTVEPE